jgi:phosphogluconate dehydratase
MPRHPVLERVTARIVTRSHATRQAYLDRTRAMAGQKVERANLSCTNLAHGVAAMPDDAKIRLKAQERPNLAIVSAYNDMLSAHQPLEAFPRWIKEAALAAGGTAQFAGGTPAMCDGVTQGQDGMDLSLFSRDVIAMATAVALSHQMFDGVLYLGVCDKIVPGLVMGALSFGHLPAVFVPGGPMTTGIGNEEKAHIRQLYAEGKIGRVELLEAETRSYHGPGTCTFYGTANSNQMLMEIMGLHQPRHAAARGADAPCGHPRADAGAWRRALHPGGRCARRTRIRQRHRRAGGHGRVHQSHAAPDRHGARGWHPADLGRLR